MTTPTSVSSFERRALTEGWEIASVTADAADGPATLRALAPAWQPARVPGTAADALRANGAWSLERPRDFDAEDWWYRCRFTAGPGADGARRVLRFDGLATLADVWLNGNLVLQSANMFLAHEVDAGPHLRAENELLIRFRSVARALGQRRARPRWKTRLVSHQQLRWIRTTLLGRMPGWSPPVAPVGPWRPVALEERRWLADPEVALRPRLDGLDGVLSASLSFAPIGGFEPTGGELRVGAARASLTIAREADGRVSARGEARLPGVAQWWPHTHGDAALMPVTLVLRGSPGEVRLDAGRTGFRSIALDRGDGDGFALRINGVPVFCRGACWTSSDIVTLDGSDDALRRWLTLARDGGMNMLRVGGTMIYESDRFFDLCDELGILVWHDAMFANMDYPAADDAWLDGVRAEARQFLGRVQRHPCLTVICGNSEVEQQAAMLGLPADRWSNTLFQEALPAACREAVPDVPYWPASPGGGPLPFHPASGVAHYYGVGAYLRPLSDARLSGVRFTSECLGFANVPDDPTLDAAMGGAPLVIHHPRWKERVPRDTGAGWDFEDVRDHYLASVFGVDPAAVRYADTPRYLALSRAITGEMMAATFAEWRRVGSRCRGGLVWFYQDLWPGAGWGVVDALGRPKAAYYYLRRAFAPLTLVPIDEGLNGLWLHAINDGPGPIAARLKVSAFRGGETIVTSGASDVLIPARDGVAVSTDRLFEGFRDITYAYRFGPREHDLVVADLEASDGRPLAQAFWLPDPSAASTRADLDLSASARRADGGWELVLRSRAFARTVAIDVDGFLPEDNYLHLAPGAERVIRLRPLGPDAPMRIAGTVAALNGHTAIPISSTA